MTNERRNTRLSTKVAMGTYLRSGILLILMVWVSAGNSISHDGELEEVVNSSIVRTVIIYIIMEILIFAVLITDIEKLEEEKLEEEKSIKEFKKKEEMEV